MAERSYQQGFTLLEILIAMTLLSIMLLLIFGTLRISMKSWDAGEKEAAETTNRLIVQRFLRKQLTSAQPLVDNFSEDEPAFSFQGRHDRLQFVSLLPVRAGLRGPHKFSLYLAEDGDRKNFMVRIEPFYPVFEDVEAKSEEVILLENVEHLAFAYYGQEEPGAEAGWMDAWEEKNHLPKLIKLTVQLVGAKEWPELLIEPKIEKISE